MNTKPTVTLCIWGYRVVLKGFANDEVDEIRETFAGAVHDSPCADQSGDPLFLYRIVGLGRADERRSRRRPRHRGGSDARKFFLDGQPFVAHEQRRDIYDHGDGAYSWPTSGGGRARIDVAASQVHVTCDGPLPPLLLSDIVEDWLLVQTRQEGAVQVHCSAWVDEHDSAHLVVGSSGVGKTTELFRAIADGMGFLSNDRAFLRLGPSGLETRSFPLPVNVGCGTIRSLGIELPHFDLADTDKIRLRAPEVADKYGADYSTWYPVRAITCRSIEDFDANIYWDEDECHPWWIAEWKPRPIPSNIHSALWAAATGLLTEMAVPWHENSSGTATHRSS